MTRFATHLQGTVVSNHLCAIPAVCLSIFLCFASFTGTTRVSPAYAETDYTDASADALQLEVERTAAAYDEAVEQAASAEEATANHKARIEELEQAIPAQAQRSSEAAVNLYKFQSQTPGIVDFLLDSKSFYDLITSLDYVNYVTQSHTREMNKLVEMKAQLDEELVGLEAARDEANEHVAEAQAALTAAQEARMEAQRKAQEAERQRAEAAAAAAVAAAGGVNPTTNGDGAEAANASPAGQVVVTGGTSQAVEEAVAAVDDGANWSSDEAAFVQSWAARIDAYLAGTPLAGQGRTFAQAAWTYGVDPRWSPAISFTESSCGAACFLPHNAWGWGSVSWGSWEEAIDAHVRGLARGYGYTISMDAAQKYCPPNAQHWYDTTLAQMNQI